MVACDSDPEEHDEQPTQQMEESQELVFTQSAESQQELETQMSELTGDVSAPEMEEFLTAQAPEAAMSKFVAQLNAAIETVSAPSDDGCSASDLADKCAKNMAAHQCLKSLEELDERTAERVEQAVADAAADNLRRSRRQASLEAQSRLSAASADNPFEEAEREAAEGVDVDAEAAEEAQLADDKNWDDDAFLLDVEGYMQHYMMPVDAYIRLDLAGLGADDADAVSACGIRGVSIIADHFGCNQEDKFSRELRCGDILRDSSMKCWVLITASQDFMKNLKKLGDELFVDVVFVVAN